MVQEFLRLTAETGLLEQALATRSDLLPSCHFLGVAQRRMGASEQALETFRRCRTIDPDHAATLAELARVHFDRGKIRDARRALRAAKRRGHQPDAAFARQLRRGRSEP